MRKTITALLAAGAVLAVSPALAADRGSSGRQAQQRAAAEIPVCNRNLGALAIVEPENHWWREYNLGSPEAVLKVIVQRSGCFTMVNRGRSMQSRAMERAMADNGELQDGSNVGRAQVRTADYFLEPDIVSANRNSGGGGGAGMLGGLFGGGIGAIVGGISVKKGEANVTLSMVNARTTEEMGITEGYARKTDTSFGMGGGGFFGGVFGAAGGGGYQDTAIGQIIVLAYIDAYRKMVGQLGGLPDNAAAAAPTAR